MNQEVTSATEIKVKNVNRDFMEYETAHLGPFLNLFFRKNKELMETRKGIMEDEDISSLVKILTDKSNLKKFYEVSLLLSIPGEFGYHDVVYPVYKGIFYPNPKSMSKLIKKVKWSVHLLYLKITILALGLRSKDLEAIGNFSQDLITALYNVTLKMADLLPSIIIYTQNNGKENE